VQVHLELLVRILVGTLLGGAIGYERDLHGRPAGLRTHAIVALASATFMVVSTRFVYYQHYGKDDLVAIDPSRIAASVVSGIGFLGAGAILRDGITVKGLSTAAGLLLVDAIGMAAGGGMYVESLFATVIGLGALTLLRRFEDRGGRFSRCRLSLSVDPTRTTLATIAERLVKLGATIKREEYARSTEGPETRATFELRLPAAFDDQAIVDLLERDDAVRALKLQQIERDRPAHRALLDLDHAGAAPVAGVPAAARTIVPLDPVAARAVARPRRSHVAARAGRPQRDQEPQHAEHASQHGSSLASAP
jgi:putative Mg2+ transporter-C (MgtC) family protein